MFTDVAAWDGHNFCHVAPLPILRFLAIGAHFWCHLWSLAKCPPVDCEPPTFTAPLLPCNRIGRFHIKNELPMRTRGELTLTYRLALGSPRATDYPLGTRLLRCGLSNLHNIISSTY